MKRQFPIAAAVSALALSLTACSNEPEIDEDTDLAAEDEEFEVATQSREITDYAELALGAKIVGPRGPEVISRMSNADAAFADLRSYVACPAGMDPCDPASAPEGTIFTYVHVVYPGEDNDPDTGSGTGNDSSDVETMEAFRMTMPSHGFTGVAGFSIAEAQAALGEVGSIIITCHEDGISWTVEEGDGGDQWEQAEPITFFWQSTLPPAGPQRAYEVFANYTAAQGDGPHPANDETVTNACAVG